MCSEHDPAVAEFVPSLGGNTLVLWYLGCTAVPWVLAQQGAARVGSRGWVGFQHRSLLLSYLFSFPPSAHLLM